MRPSILFKPWWPRWLATTSEALPLLPRAPIPALRTTVSQTSSIPAITAASIPNVAAQAWISTVAGIADILSRQHQHPGMLPQGLLGQGTRPPSMDAGAQLLASAANLGLGANPLTSAASLGHPLLQNLGTTQQHTLRQGPPQLGGANTAVSWAFPAPTIPPSTGPHWTPRGYSNGHLTPSSATWSTARSTGKVGAR